LITLTANATSYMVSDLTTDWDNAINGNFADETFVNSGDENPFGVQYIASQYKIWRVVFHFQKNFSGYVQFNDNSNTIGTMTIGCTDPAENSLGDRDECRAIFMLHIDNNGVESTLGNGSWNDFGNKIQSNSTNMNSLGPVILKTITWPTSTTAPGTDAREARHKMEKILNKDNTHLGVMLMGSQDFNALSSSEGGTNTQPDAVSQIMRVATHAHSDTSMRPTLNLNADVVNVRPFF
tara:strand:+ start:802 stop:1512 length:711 start_codon:yes stop_codon:yes gene_type:complete